MGDAREGIDHLLYRCRTNNKQFDIFMESKLSFGYINSIRNTLMTFRRDRMTNNNNTNSPESEVYVEIKQLVVHVRDASRRRKYSRENVIVSFVCEVVLDYISSEFQARTIRFEPLHQMASEHNHID